MSSPREIFISHAIRDRKLVEEFSERVRLGLDLKSENIFCSSLEGMDIPPGVNFSDFIREQIHNPRIVIFMISPAFLESQFCMCELGATWVMAHEQIPLLIPPVGNEHMRGVLGNVQAERICEKESLNKLAERIKQNLQIEVNLPVWSKNVDKFLRKVENLYGSEFTVVPAEKYNDLNATYNSLLEENEKLEEEIQSQKDLIKKLENAKSSEEVAKIMAPTEDIEKFTYLIQSCKEAGNLYSAT